MLRESYSRAKLALLDDDLDAAERHYRAATAGFARFDRPVMNSMCLGMVADFDERAGDYPAAIKALEAAIETNQTLLGGFTGSLLSRLGWVLLEDGQTTRAETVYRQALASGRRVQHTMVVFLSLAGVAALDRIHGRNDEAAAAATEALEIYRAGGPRRFRNRVDTAADLQAAAAVCCVVLAVIAEEAGDPEPAAALLARGRGVARRGRCRVPWFQRDDSTGCGRRFPAPEAQPGRSGVQRRARRQVSALLDGGVVPQTAGPLQEDPVSAFLYRLGRNSARHPFVVIGVWLVAAVLVIGLQATAGGKFDNSRAGARRRVAARGRRAERALPEPGWSVRPHRVPHRCGPARRRRTRADGEPGPSATRHRARRRRRHGSVRSAGRRRQCRRQNGVRRRRLRAGQAHAAQLHDATAVAQRTRAGGVQVELTGPLAQLEQKPPSSELIGVGIAIIVLLIAFGSVVAMGLPIVTALMGIFVGAAAVGVLSAFMNVPEFSMILCMMIGLGVGIDYALFIVTRHRQNLHEGMSVEDSAGTATATAGQAVLFAGTTVVIAILGLFLAGLPAISAMGVSVALVVIVGMAAALTLLPGLLGLAGTKIDKLSIHRKSHVTKPAHETVSGRWANHVGGHSVRYAIVSLGSAVRDRGPGAQHAHRRPRRWQCGQAHHAAHGLRRAGAGFRSGIQRPDPSGR